MLLTAVSEVLPELQGLGLEQSETAVLLTAAFEVLPELQGLGLEQSEVLPVFVLPCVFALEFVLDNRQDSAVLCCEYNRQVPAVLCCCLS